MSTETRTIAIVSPYFPPAAGGLERYASEIANLLHTEHGYRIVVLTSGEKGGADVQEVRDGYTVYRLGYSFKVSNTPFSFAWFGKVRRILQKESPDVVHIHTPVPGIGDIAAFFARVPVVVTYHASTMRKGKGNSIVNMIIAGYEKILLPFLLSKAEKIICASDFIRDDFLSAYKEKSITLTPGVYPEHFTPNAFLKSKSPTILFVAGRIGRTDTYKGLDTLLDAMALVSKKVPSARLVVVGDGDMLYEYEMRAERLTPGIVSFTGTLHGEMLTAEYQKAHVLAHPSRNESFGMVILEAMATELPVVATNVGGIPTLLQDGKTGFLVPPGNSEMLAEKLIEVLTDHELSAALGKNGRLRAIENYSWSGRATTYHTIFESFIRPEIVHAVGYYPPHIGGMERVAETISKLLAKDNWRVRVLTSNGSLRGEVERSENLVVKRLASFEFAHTPIAPSLPFHLFSISKRSIIHLHLSQAFWPEWILLVSKLRGIPYVLHLHLDVAPSGPLGPLFLIYKKMIWGPVIRNASLVIACSDDLARMAVEVYGAKKTKLEIMPNAVNDNFFSARAYTVPADRLRLLSIGRLAPQKKTERLVKMMPLLKIPAELIIAGDGEDRATLEALVRGEKIPNVTFVGEKNDAEMRALHEAADAFVIASDREGRPLAVLEAMAAGLPIIASDVVGNHELVGGVGILVSPPTPEAFATAINTLWQNKESLETLSKRSVKRASEATWDSVIRRLENIYTTLI